MVASEGAPTQRDLGQIPCSDDQPLNLIGKIHKDLSTFPGLRVLVDEVGQILRVVNILKVLSDRRFDGDAFDIRRLEPSLAQEHCREFGPWFRARAW